MIYNYKSAIIYCTVPYHEIPWIQRLKVITLCVSWLSSCLPCFVLYCPQLQSDSILVTFVFKPKQPTNSDARLHCSQSQEFPGTKITWRLVVAKGPSLAAWLLDGFHGKIHGDGGLMRIVSPWLRKPPSLTSTFKLYEFTNHLGVLSEGLMV